MLPSETLLQGRFLILEVLSKKGGMGIVYLAKDQRLGGTVVVKEIRYLQLEESPSRELQKELLKAFKREARLLANLKHPALPRVIDCFAEDHRHFIVMDYVEGKDLEEVLKERNGQPFPVEQVLAWADELLDALNYLHSRIQPIVHRDIKPANLKLTPHGKIMLLDFGLAKGSVTGSKAHSIFGYTKEYAPLEQIEDKGTDVRSDLFSLAVTLYQLVTGVLPPDALTRVRTSFENQHDPIKPVNDLNPQVPPALAEVLHRAMSLIADVRPATAKDMQRALREIHLPTVLAETPLVVQKPNLPSETPIITRPRTAKLRSAEAPERAARQAAEPLADEMEEGESLLWFQAVSCEDAAEIAEPDFEEAYPAFQSALATNGEAKPGRSKLLERSRKSRRTLRAIRADRPRPQVSQDERAANTDWSELIKELAGLALLVLGVIVLCSLFSYDPLDSTPAAPGANSPVRNWIGPVGASLATQLYAALGWFSWGSSIALLCAGWFLLRPPELHLPAPRLFGWLLVLFAVAGLLALSDLDSPRNGYYYRSGWLGQLLVREGLVSSLNVIGAFILLAAILVAGILISTSFSLSHLPKLLDELIPKLGNLLDKLFSDYANHRSANNRIAQRRLRTRRLARARLRGASTKRNVPTDSADSEHEDQADNFSSSASD